MPYMPFYRCRVGVDVCKWFGEFVDPGPFSTLVPPQEFNIPSLDCPCLGVESCDEPSQGSFPDRSSFYMFSLLYARPREVY